MPQNSIGMMVFIFLIFYYAGIMAMIMEKKMGKHGLPKILKTILFIGVKYNNTINTIVYQSGILMNFVISLSLSVVDGNNKEMIFKRYILCTVILFLFETIFIAKLHIKEEIIRKKRR